MSDTSGPVADPTPPTEPLQLADQQPLAQIVEQPAPARTNHSRTILEVVAGVIAVFAIAAAGLVGFAAGHATGGRDDRPHDRFAAADGPTGQGFGQGQRQQGQGQQGQGQQGFGQPGQGIDPRGIDPRGIDPDGDNWTGGMMGGQGQGFGQGQGIDPRGMMPGFGDDNDDDWGGMMPGLGQQ